MSLTKSSIAALNEAFDKLLRTVGINSGTFSDFLQSQNALEITEPLTLYVETTGNDSNDGSQNRPFKTIQRAIDYLKQYTIKAAVTVQVGVGTFDGFIVEGLDFESLDNLGTQVAGLNIMGTPTLSTLSTGLNSGSVTSAALATERYGHVTMTDSTQAWTVDELKGKFLSVSGSSSVYWPIVSNTATTLCTICGSVTGFAGSTYSINDLGTVISPSATVKTPSTGGVSATSTVTASIFFQNSTSHEKGSTAPSVWISRLKTTGTSGGYTLVASSGGVGVRECYISTNSSGVERCVVRPGVSVFLANYSFFESIHSSGGTALYLGSSFSSFFRCIFKANVKVGSVGVSLTSSGKHGIGTCNFENLGIGADISRGIACTNTISPLYSLNCSSVVTISGRGYAEVGGSNGALKGSGNTTFITASKGAAVAVSSNITSGAFGSTNEILIDGESFSIANLRAVAGPPAKLLTNTYGTIVYE